MTSASVKAGSSLFERRQFARLRLIIIWSGIPRRTPRAPSLCNGSLSSHIVPPGACAPSGGRRSARPYFGRGTSGHHRLAVAQGRLGGLCGPGLPTRCLGRRASVGSRRHRRPGRRQPLRVASAVFLGDGAPTPDPLDRRRRPPRGADRLTGRPQAGGLVGL